MKHFDIALFVALGCLGFPLACGDDDASPNGGDAGSAGSGGAPGETGGSGSGGISGESTGGSAGEGTGGKASGGEGGKSTGGSSGEGRGGAGGTRGNPGGVAGRGGASEGGVGGASDDGEGGEGVVDERAARISRICEKAEAAAMCPDMSTCASYYFEFWYRHPHCRPYADRYLICVDENGTEENFTCGAEGVFEFVLPVSCYDEYDELFYFQDC